MLKLPSVYTPADRILWDVVDEHLSEAAFEYTRWNAALRSPRYTLHELAEGPEEYLLAHLRGVMLAGKSGCERLILPNLQPAVADDPALLAIAAAVAFCFGYRDQLVLMDAEQSQRGALLDGLRLCDDSSFDKWIVANLNQGMLASPHRVTLLGLAADRQLCVENLTNSLLAVEPQEAAVAVRAAVWADRGRHLGMVEELILHPHHEVRLNAQRTALTWGSARAFQLCLEHTRDSCAGDLLEFVAILGGPQEHELLFQLLRSEVPGLRQQAILAIGLSGNVRAVPLLIALLGAQDSVVAKLAGEALVLITGLAADDPRFHRELPLPSAAEAPQSANPELMDEDRDTDFQPSEVQNLPCLDADAVAGWWAGVQAATDPAYRMLRGRRLSAETCLTMLRDAPMRSRRAIANLVHVRSAGRYRLPIDRPSAQQLRELAILQPVPDLLSGNTLLRW